LPRKSAASLSVVAPLPAEKRPDPPDELTDEEAVEWRSVVDRLPPDWFPRESHQLLVQYCRHVVKARIVARLIGGLRMEKLETLEDLHTLDRLMAMADREARGLSSLATRMRISQQSRYLEKKAGVKASNPNASRKPWQHVA
jgi:hypothetical protein